MFDSAYAKSYNGGGTEGRKSAVEKVRYMISDAANLVNVETHVLRYWEDELALTIPRNEMGHRYYTKENIKEFQKIKELKDKGYQLKAIRMLIHNGNIEEFTPVDHPADQPMEQPALVSAGQAAKVPAASVAATEPVLKQSVREMDAENRMTQFRELMAEIVGHAISLNNEELSIAISQEVQERILKEMDYLARAQEDAEEERFRKLDAAIRGNVQKRHSLFRKKDKKSGINKKEDNKKRLSQ